MIARGGSARSLSRSRPRYTAPRLHLSPRQHKTVHEVASALISDEIRHSFLLRVESILARQGSGFVTDNHVQNAITSALQEVLG